ncbi:hypothetical protein KUC3_34600 [Alteromonas sp. KC3]|uniref:DUF6326 family protein n=1 Tax=unclassified Alteromonas TaxID=2614992 RepID=UPI001923120F|nr:MULTISPECIES: DUF6326 family protein [unclassified Alteromonas]BCO20603.1 hypothetical protein KUC3_34600 [Alteromonas sp. KC3]BCO24572.1 hypothetical protein KUC14_34410 [Alteromonas sp. KC14]
MNNSINQKLQFSSLWVFVLFNTLFRDIHEFLRPGVIENMNLGLSNGVQVSEYTLFIAAFVLQMPLLMFVLPFFLRLRNYCKLSIFVGITTFAGIWFESPHDMDDWAFAAFKSLTIAFILYGNIKLLIRRED